MDVYMLLAVIQCGLLGSTAASRGPRTVSVTYSVKEQQTAGRMLGNLYQDTDIKTFVSRTQRPLLQYRIVTTNNPQAKLFKIDSSSGDLSTRTLIDREDLCPKMTNCLINLDILVRPNQYFTVVKARIFIEDINDNSPRFRQNVVSLPVSEGVSPDSTLILPSPIDNDSPRFGIVAYRLQTNFTKFELVKIAGEETDILSLKVVSKLDREEIDNYHMTLYAVDGGEPSLTGTLEINIKVIDLNDNRPVFKNKSYNVSVSENVPYGSVILNCTAKDSDLGENGRITYSLSRPSVLRYGSLVKIDENTGALSIIGELDYETEHVIPLTVTAKDNGPNSLPSATKVTINVLDENDNSPSIVFQKPENRQYLTISENSPIGSVVSYLTIWDPDKGSNGNVSCSVSGRNFTLQHVYQSEYQLVVSSIMHHRTGVEYIVTVVCEDRGLIRRKTIKTVVVKVEDINDHAPEFDQSEYSVVVPETVPLGTSVLRVYATDKDSGNNSKISFTLHQKYDHFRINEQTGILYTVALLDFETLGDYVLTVTAKDKGKPPKSSNVTAKIALRNENDEKPEFHSNHFVFGIHENEPVNTNFGNVVAFDRDGPPFNQITYSLSDNSEFKINSKTGAISTSVELDRETEGVYYLTVYATDSHNASLSAAAAVTVHVADKNDHKPTFEFPSSSANLNKASVSSNDDIGQLVCQVKVSDGDAGLNGKWSYFLIKGNKENIFIINPRSGIILLNKQLPLDKDEYELTIMVQDYGKPPLSSTEKLFISVNHTDARSAALSDTFYPLPPVVGVSVAAGIIILALGLLLINLRYNICDRRRCCGGLFYSSTRKDNINREIGLTIAKLANKESAIEQQSGPNNLDLAKQNNLTQAAEIQNSDSDSGRGFSDYEQWPHIQQDSAPVSSAQQPMQPKAAALYTFGRKRKSSEADSYAIYPNRDFDPSVSCDTIEPPTVPQKPWYLQDESYIVKQCSSPGEPTYAEVFQICDKSDRSRDTSARPMHQCKTNSNSTFKASQQYLNIPTSSHSGRSNYYSDVHFPVDIPVTSVSEEYFPTEDFGRSCSQRFTSTDTEINMHCDDDSTSLRSNECHAIV